MIHIYSDKECKLFHRTKEGIDIPIANEEEAMQFILFKIKPNYTYSIEGYEVEVKHSASGRVLREYQHFPIEFIKACIKPIQKEEDVSKKEITLGDIEFIIEYAKCGIHHNSLNEIMLESRLDRLRSIKESLKFIITRK